MSEIDWRKARDEYWWGLPSELPAVAGAIYWDTETSGLHPDDGARVSVVSTAWVEWDGEQEQSGGQEPVIRWTAWPFAQGKVGKPEDDGQDSLFGGDDANLELVEWQALLKWLRYAGCGLIGHNAKFDVTMTRAGVRGLREGTDHVGWMGLDLTERVIWDTQIAAKELDPNEKTALKGPGSVSERYWGATDDEKQALKKHLGPKTNPRYDLVPWEIMRPYAAMDALMTARAHLIQLQRVARGEVAQGGGPQKLTGQAWVQREVELMRVLCRMERRGVPYDAAGSRKAAAEVAKRMAATERRMGLPIAQVKDYYFGRGRDGQPVEVVDLDGVRRRGRGLEPYAVTPKKQEPQLTAEVIEDMIRDGIGGAAELRDYNRLAVANKMWYKPYADGTGADGRLRTVFRQVASGFEGEGGTASGRFSVERVNLQAIPHDYRLGGEDGVMAGVPTPRQLITAAERRMNRGRAAGTRWHLWELDLAQAELRVAAMWAECERMLSAIREERDLHGETTTDLFGLRKGDEAFGQFRQVAKRANFSLIFGSGWLTFQRMVKKQAGLALSNPEAQRIVSEWNQLYPEFRRAIDKHSRKIEHADWQARGMPLVNGRMRWWRAFEDTHKAFNQRVQASLAELGKDWMIRSDLLGRELGVPQRGLDEGIGEAGLLITIHDSQVWLLPEQGGQQVAQQIAGVGRDVWSQMFPGVPGDIDVKRWSEK
ncbi:MAG TPA: aminoadenine-incorporating DNA polymerase DpoZ [Nocardioidaceae bacterium]|nr:aminoadenine-incorporating DNA polymerase DpoZ [Nocardioidaceae bacterium]